MNAGRWRVVGGAGLAGALVLGLGLALAPAAAPAVRGRPASDEQELVFLGEARPVLIRMHVRVDGRPVEAAWEDFIKELFAYLDVNGDGVLDKAEAERVPSVDQIRNGGLSLGGGRGFGRGSGPPSLAALDTDKDGKVSLAELGAYYRKSGLAPFQFDLGPEPFNPFRAAAFFGRAPEPKPEEVRRAIFALLDADGDGKLTKEELAAAPAVLLRMDEDEDEIVTPRELVPNAKPFDPFSAGMAMLGPSSKSGPANKTVVPVPTPGQAPPALVSAMQERYGPKGKKAAQKGLSRKDLGLDEATFRQLDANGDGVLDAKELEGFVKRPPDLEVMVRLDTKGAGPRVEVVSTGPRRSPLAGQVQRLGGVALLDLGVTRVELRGRGEEGRNDLFAGLVRQQIQAQFKGADKDNNGYLDKKEADASPTFRGLFQAMDRDGDGKLYEQEVLAYLERYAKLQAKATASCASLAFADVSRGLFDMLDVNRDGRLSVREMRGAAGLLKRLDRGGKGYLTEADVPRTYQLTVRRGPAGGPTEAAAFAKIYGGYGAGEGEQPAAVGPLWFRKMDRNRDGDVSRKEWLFSEERFREIDTDGDGLISLEEAERYEARRRKQK
jgi:Ca2+-binding EF-hand superfamily protein